MMIRHFCTFGKHRGRNTFSLNLTNYGSSKAQQHISSLVSSIRKQLHQAESQGRDTKGCVLITAADGESCTGLDCRSAQGAADSGSAEARKNRFLDMINLFKPVVADLISLPMPTIAVLNGPSTVAGLLLSLSHDYLIMKRDITSLRSDELSADLSLPPFFEALIRSKAFCSKFPPGNSVTCGALRFNAQEAHQIGFLNGKEEVGKDAVELAETLEKYLASKKWNGQVYAELRKALHPELCKELGLTCETILPKFEEP